MLLLDKHIFSCSKVHHNNFIDISRWEMHLNFDRVLANLSHTLISPLKMVHVVQQQQKSVIIDISSLQLIESIQWCPATISSCKWHIAASDICIAFAMD